ncbi:MAG: tetratricopeptide repeat protein [Bacteroidales bacterium]
MILMDSWPGDLRRSQYFCGLFYKKILSLALYLACTFVALPIGLAEEIPHDIKQKIQKADSLAGIYHYSEAINHLQKAIVQANEGENILLMAVLNNKIGSILSQNGQDREAIPYFRNSIELAIKVNDSIVLSDAQNNLGIIFEYTGYTDSAFFYYEKALRIRESLQDTTNYAASLRNMAQILRVLRRLHEAKHYCSELLSLIPGIKEYKIIANIYNEMAYLCELDGQLDSAKQFYQKLIEISQINNYQMGISVGYSNLASVYEKEQNFYTALELKKLGLQLDLVTGNIYGQMTSHRTLADTYLHMNDFQSALLHLDSAEIICDSTWLSDLYGIHNARYRAWKGKGQFQKALFAFEKATILKDSLYSEKNRKNISEILIRYETEKKEQQIEILSQANQIHADRIKIQILIMILIILFSLSGALASFLIILKKNSRIKEMNLEIRSYLLFLKNQPSGLNRPNNKFENPLSHLKQSFQLTQREAEIMELISHGLTNSDLAIKLFVSENTIKYHIKNIYIKLDVKNRVQALQKTHFNNPN